MTKRVSYAAAVLTIRQASKMTSKGRRSIAVWLHKQAEHLVNTGDAYNELYTGRYLSAEPRLPKKEWRPRKSNMIKAAFKPPANRSPRKRYGR